MNRAKEAREVDPESSLVQHRQLDSCRPLDLHELSALAHTVRTPEFDNTKSFATSPTTQSRKLSHTRTTHTMADAAAPPAGGARGGFGGRGGDRGGRGRGRGRGAQLMMDLRFFGGQRADIRI